MSNDLVERYFGYNIEKEDVSALIRHGVDAEIGLQLMRSIYPAHNPEASPWATQQYQGQQGACAGHAVALLLQVITYMTTGQQLLFSRANAYYEAQRKSGITGDNGSTLDGCQRVLNSDGVTLEKYWPYPSRYDNKRPAGLADMPRVFLRSSKPVTDAEMFFDLLAAGACIQTGVAWTNSFETDLCDSYTRSGNVGGHSTTVYGLNEGRGINHNSWNGWQARSRFGPGRQAWTPKFVKSIYSNDKYCTFIAYTPVGAIIDPRITSDLVL